MVPINDYHSNALAKSWSGHGSWWRPAVLAFLALIPIAYSLWVSWVVAWTGDIGLNCVVGIVVKEQVADDYAWEPSRPEVGDVLEKIGTRPIATYPDYVEAMRQLRRPARFGGPSRLAVPPRGRSRGGRDGPVSPVATVSLVVALAAPGDGHPGGRGVCLREEATRRVGAAVLRPLHRHGGGLHGRLPLGRGGRRADADLSVRGVRDLCPGGQPPISIWYFRV